MISRWIAESKKRRHELFAVRAGRPVTQTTSRSGVVTCTVSITGISTAYYRFGRMQIPKLKVSQHVGFRILESFDASDRRPPVSRQTAEGRMESGESPMTNPPESSSSPPQSAQTSRPSGWLKVGAVAAASALAGGLAAAWFYRKTLTRLRQAEDQPPNPAFNMTESDLDEDS